MKIKNLITTVTLSAILASSSQAVTIANYEFTNHALTNSAGAVSGITISDFTIGTGMGDLTDNGAPNTGAASDALRISGDDTESSSGAAFTNNAFMTFTVTIDASVIVNFDKLSLDHKRFDSFGLTSSRVFSTIQGNDDLAEDTIGVFGINAKGTDPNFITTTLDLNGGMYSGGNISDADFDGLTNTTVTFSLPWIDNSDSDARYHDIDNLVLEATVTPVPEPSSTALLGLGGSTHPTPQKIIFSR